jgi:branched-chain amino acid transport system substrate-binding protein
MVRLATLVPSVFCAAALLPATSRAEALIGVADPLTGPLAWLGEQHQRPVEMAVAEINAGGGLLGQPVAIVAADDFWFVWSDGEYVPLEEAPAAGE